MGGTHYFVLRQGGGWILVTSLRFITKKRPCLHYHNLQDLAHQRTRPVLLADVKFWIASGDSLFKFTGTIRRSRSNEQKCTQPCAAAYCKDTPHGTLSSFPAVLERCRLSVTLYVIVLFLTKTYHQTNDISLGTSPTVYPSTTTATGVAIYAASYWQTRAVK